MVTPSNVVARIIVISFFSVLSARAQEPVCNQPSVTGWNFPPDHVTATVQYVKASPDHPTPIIDWNWDTNPTSNGSFPNSGGMQCTGTFCTAQIGTVSCGQTEPFYLHVRVYCIPGTGNYSNPVSAQVPLSQIKPKIDLSVEGLVVTVNYSFGSSTNPFYRLDMPEYEGAPAILGLVQVWPTSSSGSDQWTLPRPGIVQGTASNGGCGPTSDKKLATANPGCPFDRNEPPTGTDNPIRFADGNAQYNESDPTPGNRAFRLSRRYDSTRTSTGVFGVGWSSALDASLVEYYGYYPSFHTLLIRDMEGEYVAFSEYGGTYTQILPAGVQTKGILKNEGSALVYREAGSSRALVFNNGKLTEVRDLASRDSVSFSYAGGAINATDANGNWSWGLSALTSGKRLLSVSGQPNLSLSYCYAATAHLESVKLGDVSCAAGDPSQKWRSYQHTAEGLLSAANDPMGNLIEGHTYANGRATGESSDESDIQNVVYGLPGDTADERVTQITYANGNVERFHVRWIASRPRTVRIEGSGCTSCGGAKNSYSFDGEGRVKRAQNARGYVTEYNYDSSGNYTGFTEHLRRSDCDPTTSSTSCLLLPDMLASASLVSTSATRTVTLARANGTWPDQVTTTTTESVLQSNDVTTTSLSLDAITATPLQTSVSGWTGDASAPTRQTRTTTRENYTGTELPAFNPFTAGTEPSWFGKTQPANRLKKIDAPRDPSDAVDVTLFVYYPIDVLTVPNAPDRGQLAATKAAAGLITRYENYDVFGNARRIIDPNGVVTERTFDRVGRILSSTLKGMAGCNTTADPLCATDLVTTTTYYNTVGPMKSVTAPGGGYTEYAYDARGRLTTIKRGPNSTTLVEQMEHTFDPATGKKNQERLLALEGGFWVAKKMTKYEYDSEGRLARTFYPPFATPLTAGDYDSVEYDAANDITQTKDARHSAANTKYIYDPAGRVASVLQLANLATNTWISTSYVYDKAGNLRTVTDPNSNVTTYVVDDFGQVIETISPATGTTSQSYDAAGNLTSTTDANGAITTRVYDGGNRQTSLTATNQAISETVIWSYDNSDPTAYGKGAPASMTDPSGSTAYLYTRAGALREEQRTIDGASHTTKFEYDRNGNRSKITYPSARVVGYTHDFAGRPLTMTNKPANKVLNAITGASYLPFGPLTSLTFESGPLQRSVTYDNRYRISENKFAAGATILARYTYQYDAASNVDLLTDAQNTAFTRDFGYDDLSRLTSANTSASLWGAGSYAYDLMGNLTSVDLGSVHDVSFLYETTTPKIISATDDGLTIPMQYDAAGNEIKGTVPAETRAYSPRNLLAEVTGTPRHVMSYDGRSVRLLMKRYSGATLQLSRSFIYSPELNLLSYKDGAATATDILWFGGVPVAQQQGANAVRYTFVDHLGTPVLQASNARTPAVLWRAEHDPYGHVLQLRTGTREEQILRFPGQELAWQSTSGEEEMYNIFRWYRSGWGRYTQPDPIGLRGGLNLFGYAYQNPILFSDPDGLRVRVCCKTIPITVFFRHCFFDFDGYTIGLHGAEDVEDLAFTLTGHGVGNVEWDHGFDYTSDPDNECGPWSCEDDCVAGEAASFPTFSRYRLVVQNSNSFAGSVTRKCNVLPPFNHITSRAPGWNNRPGRPIGSR